MDPRDFGRDPIEPTSRLWVRKLELIEVNPFEPMAAAIKGVDDCLDDEFEAERSAGKMIERGHPNELSARATFAKSIKSYNRTSKKLG